MPPKRKPDRPGAARHDLAHQLREVIESRGLSSYAAARLADVDPGVVSRFMSGERDIRLDTAGRLAAALGLRLVEVGRRGPAGRKAREKSPRPDHSHEHPHGHPDRPITPGPGTAAGEGPSTDGAGPRAPIPE